MKINLLQLARITQQDTETLQLICSLLGIPIQADQLPAAFSKYVEEVCRLHQEEGMELEDGVQQVLASMPTPSDTSNDPQFDDSDSGLTQDPTQVAIAVRSKIGSVLQQIQTQGNDLLAQVDEHILQSAQEFNAQLEARPNLFWLAVAEGHSGNDRGPQIHDLLQRPLSAPILTGRLNRRALLPLPTGSQNWLVG